jgi:hypothetical protein
VNVKKCAAKGRNKIWIGKENGEKGLFEWGGNEERRKGWEG